MSRTRSLESHVVPRGRLPTAPHRRTPRGQAPSCSWGLGRRWMVRPISRTSSRSRGPSQQRVVSLFDPEELKTPDVLLGDLKDRDRVDVHQRVLAHIDVPTSSPNAWHEAIVALMETRQPLRIVTTNYDRHLEALLTDPTVSQYRAPALPVGDDFTGLVYLHGCIDQQPSRFVVTDEDFGHAYLRDAWATRFLDRMFREFTVLFIGYSHSDVVMSSFLRRALGRRTDLTPYTFGPRSRSHWRRLGSLQCPPKGRVRSHSGELWRSPRGLSMRSAPRSWTAARSSGCTRHRSRDRHTLPCPARSVLPRGGSCRPRHGLVLHGQRTRGAVADVGIRPASVQGPVRPSVEPTRAHWDLA